ncbi:hypothetical protein [Clostridium sp. BNL1100]|uniref:hypothetical protein n=1 Tax=Clostridium sp. BNL1100 TaxID=755731 RepID=UPI00024A7811|nr:hypothetical protein [Clostridium sp. BNL1100]AEY66091.1 hypothetical protein Clo1100_1887 [Clostridium sp. BNL1100]
MDVLVKQIISENTGVEQDKLYNEFEGKLVFVYDEESGGELSLCFGEDETSSFDEISSDYVCDIITINEIASSVINWNEE